MKGAGQQTAPDFSSSLQNPAMIEAALALLDNKLSDAEPLLRAELKSNPFNVAAIRMMAELAGRIGRLKDAESLLRRALELSPGFAAARSNLATVLYRQNRPLEAVSELSELQAHDPDHLGNANLKAAALGRLGDFAEALALYDQILARLPDHPKVLMSYGHTLKTVGRQDQSISAYRRALGVQPALGEVWWSLANLKTVRFSADDVGIMEAGLVSKDASEDDCFHLHFALGKAYEDGRDAAASFAHYEAGNRLRSAMLGYDAADTSAQVEADIRLFTPEFFADRAGQGCPDSAPIFILGMPRAGSTLIEQILASHSLIEGTMELPDIPVLAQRQGGPAQWAARIADMTSDQLRKTGETYIERTRIQRRTSKPFFIDKLPNNWANVGFIKLILPNAKIIDARRHPLACCFSNYKQHFARGQAFTYGLDDMGRYYADYVRQMAHFDQVLPGAVTRVIHEDMLEDNEGEIRRLMAALDLPFEETCLRFWENDRAVRTASSEQVRRPINRDGADQWQLFDPWLVPLRAALGAVLTDYPVVPKKWAAL
jgi:tetratricopeptide (TPR) repeat protein